MPDASKMLSQMSVSKNPPELSRSGQFGAVVATSKDIVSTAGSTILLTLLNP